MSEVEVRSRPTSLLDVLEYEGVALADIGDPGLDETPGAMVALQSAILAALQALPPPAGNGHGV
jgi:hypothetical protein